MWRNGIHGALLEELTRPRSKTGSKVEWRDGRRLSLSCLGALDGVVMELGAVTTFGIWCTH